MCQCCDVCLSSLLHRRYKQQQGEINNEKTLLMCREDELQEEGLEILYRNIKPLAAHKILSKMKNCGLNKRKKQKELNTTKVFIDR